MLEQITRHIFSEKLNHKTYKAGGIKIKKTKQLKSYDNTFNQLGGLFGVSYLPKSDKVEIDVLDTKDQYPYNTCSWHAYVTMRQATEGKILSPKSSVKYAKKYKLLTGDGFSTLENNSRVGKEFGAAEESKMPNTKESNFEEYSDPTKLTKDIYDNAATHKPNSAKKFYVRTLEEYIKALDDGFVIEVGVPWYSDYNMGGGFSYPWLIKWGSGVYVGGHAIAIIGYYDVKIINGKIVEAKMIAKNSYSEAWGRKGNFDFYLSDLVKNGIVGMVEVDLDDETLNDLIKEFEGKQVKGKKGDIWLIQNGCKRAFPSAEVFFAYGGRYGKYGKTYVDINQSTLDAIPVGEVMKIEDSPFWPELLEKGITLEFLDKNRNEAIVWGDNPKTLQAIVSAMRGLLPPVFEITTGQKILNIFDLIKSLFKII